jgi:hypothetical protein
MTSATRAHTVPRFYLRGFVAPESEGVAKMDPFVWLGSLTTSDIGRRSPKNISTEIGYYDGPGGFESADASIERHLSRIESEAAVAIAKFAASPIEEGFTVAQEIWRFISWQAARTPAWFELIEDWIYHSNSKDEAEMAEPPPEGIEKIRDRIRSLCVENPDTGECIEVTSSEDFAAYRERGWKWIMRSEDRLEMLHMQAWYFQVRHFPRLSWARLNAPDTDWFITSDRGVSWVADGYADTPPAALRHPSAVVVAPLTRKVALVGRHGTGRLEVTPRQVNQLVAALATRWIAGPSEVVVAEAIRDRSSAHRLT